MKKYRVMRELSNFPGWPTITIGKILSEEGDHYFVNDPLAGNLTLEKNYVENNPSIFQELKDENV